MKKISNLLYQFVKTTICLAFICGCFILFYWQSQLVDYSRLEKLLSVHQWINADKETSQLIGSILRKKLDETEYFGSSTLDFFGVRRTKILRSEGICQELEIIDKLWRKYSEDNFGFLTQAKIALSVAEIRPLEKQDLSKLLRGRGSLTEYLTSIIVWKEEQVKEILGWNGVYPVKPLYKNPKWYLPAQNPAKAKGFLPSPRWIIEQGHGKLPYGIYHALTHFIYYAQLGKGSTSDINNIYEYIEKNKSQIVDFCKKTKIVCTKILVFAIIC